MTFRIEKLRRDHRVAGFDCGKEPLNRFLIGFALQSQLSNSSQTYLALSEDDVVGFYTLAFGDVNYEDAPERLRKGVARASDSPDDPRAPRGRQRLGRQADRIRSFEGRARPDARGGRDRRPSSLRRPRQG